MAKPQRKQAGVRAGQAPVLAQVTQHVGDSGLMRRVWLGGWPPGFHFVQGGIWPRQAARHPTWVGREE